MWTKMYFLIGISVLCIKDIREIRKCLYTAAGHINSLEYSSNNEKI